MCSCINCVQKLIQVIFVGWCCFSSVLSSSATQVKYYIGTTSKSVFKWGEQTSLPKTRSNEGHWMYTFSIIIGNVDKRCSEWPCFEKFWRTKNAFLDVRIQGTIHEFFVSGFFIMFTWVGNDIWPNDVMYLTKGPEMNKREGFQFLEWEKVLSWTMNVLAMIIYYFLSIWKRFYHEKWMCMNCDCFLFIVIDGNYVHFWMSQSGDVLLQSVNDLKEFDLSHPFFSTTSFL